MAPKTPAQVKEDAFIGRNVRLILTPLLVVLGPILVYVASAIHGISDDVGDSAIVLAEIHAEMGDVERRVDGLEDDVKECDERLRACESEVSGVSSRLTELVITYHR